MIKNQKLLKTIAEERIARLISLAKNRTVKIGASDRLSKRYTSIASDIAKHYRVGMSHQFKNEVCKGCGAVMIPGVNCSVRLASQAGYVVMRCKCGDEKHVFYRPQMQIPGTKLR